MIAEIKASRIFRRNQLATTRYVVNCGGTRSSKTYSILQLLLAIACEHRDQNLVFSVVRKSMPALRGSAYRDFLDIVKTAGMYHEENHNQTECIYHIGNCEIEFFSLDQPQKVRGRKRNYLFVNEANELTTEDFFQLQIRTTDRIFLDYNPSDIEHWIYDSSPSAMMPAAERTDIHSTYLDNPFLEPSLKKSIEQIRLQDEDYWRVYGLGEKAQSRKIIFTNWQPIEHLPDSENMFYGLDFGYNDPTALVECRYVDGEVYMRELMYESGLTNSALISKLERLLPADDASPIYADSARPELIEEMSQHGLNVFPSRKGKNSVADGIDIVKRFKLHIDSSSANLLSEIKSYQWRKDKNGNLLDEPVDFNNHLIDALRYAIADHLVNQNEFQVIFSV